VVVSIDESTDLICAGVKPLHSHAKWAIDHVQKEIGVLAAQYDLVLIDSAALRCDPLRPDCYPGYGNRVRLRGDDLAAQRPA